MIYVLTKCSGEGFSVESSSLQHIENILSMYICEACMEELSDTKISLEDLLWTACGAEFLYEKIS